MDREQFDIAKDRNPLAGNDWNDEFVKLEEITGATLCTILTFSFSFFKQPFRKQVSVASNLRKPVDTVSISCLDMTNMFCQQESEEYEPVNE